MTQHLTLEHVKTEGRKAYEAGLLMAQHPIPEERECIYDGGDGYGCIIGKALTTETLNLIFDKGLNADNGLATLIEQKIVSVDEAEVRALTQLQIEHDNWASTASEGLEDCANESRDRLLELLK